MRDTRKITLIALSVLTAFGAGYWLRGGGGPEKQARRILYYQDPMHPAYRSDKPGVAPDCGMQLEPVYADSLPPADKSMAPGAVWLDNERQQVIGLRTVRAALSAGHHVIRTSGRVEVDETRVYRVQAGTEGLIQTTARAALGDVIRPDDLLATAYARDILTAQQGYINSLIALNGGAGANAAIPATHKMKGMPFPKDAEQSTPENQQSAYLRMAVRVAEDLLRNLGVSDFQIRELATSRRATGTIEFRAPAAGVILFRNASAGQRIERGTELFRIGDLSHVWVLADLFESDGIAVRAGMAAKVHYRGQTLRARMGAGSPQVDPASRVARARLEVDNPSSVLSPGMFVEVELEVQEPEGITVAADAILDTGQRKLIFVSPREGWFEPREVTAGAKYGDRVQIVKGLAAGEQVVVSGLFLLDSESRLKRAAAMPALPAAKLSGAAAGKVTDPVCGMPMAASDAKSRIVFEGVTYYFCSESCRRRFESAPSAYARPPGARPSGSHP